jgi:hypothetical protein
MSSTRIKTGTKIEYIPLSQIKIDRRYQRNLDEGRAAAIGRNFDPTRIGTPVISRRANGDLYIIDGQHRRQGGIEAGFGDCAVACEVHSGLSTKDEAEFFLKLNNGRAAVRAIDQYRAALEAQRADALEIDSILRGLNLRIQTGNGRRSINAVRAVMSAHKRQGNLGTTLRVLTAWLDGDASAYDGELIKGVSIFLAHYGEADAERLITRLRSTTPARVLEAMARAKAQGAKAPEAACMTLVELYNSRLGAKQRLEPYIRRIAALSEAAE